MLWNWFSPKYRAQRRRIYLAQHSAWLTRAMMTDRRYPKIPTRRVDKGGFDPMMKSQGGPERASRWWSLALDRVDE